MQLMENNYEQQQKGYRCIKVCVTYTHDKINDQEINAENITNVQALLALVVVLKYYPTEWEKISSGMPG